MGHLAIQDANAEPSKPLVLDIGVNVAWVKANAVKADARVAAFEARTSPVHRTFCSAPWLKESVVLYPTHLGFDTGDCISISSDGYDSDSRKVCLNGIPEAFLVPPIGAVRHRVFLQHTTAKLVVSSLESCLTRHI